MKKLLLSTIDVKCKLSKEEKKTVIGGNEFCPGDDWMHCWWGSVCASLPLPIMPACEGGPV